MRGRFSRHEGGAALVEAALVLPVLIVLVFGLTEISLFFWQWSLANKAVHLGTRKAIVSDPVARGPGLSPAESAAYWAGLPPGMPCTVGAGDAGRCPAFSVECDAATGCRCRSGLCGFTFARASLLPILTVMRAILPQLRPENIQVTYATNNLGYVGRPFPVPVDVTVTLVGVKYETNFLGPLLGPSLPIRASATLPAEDLTSLDRDDAR